MISGREKFKRFKVIINLFVNLLSIFPKSFNQRLFSFFRNANGVSGLLLRYILLKNISNKIGENVSIHPGVFIFGFDNLIIDSNVSIHPMCYVDATGGVKIGDNVSIAHSSSILSTEHTWEDIDLPIKYNPVIKESIEIADDVWVGCGCRILSGVKIGHRSIIASGAVLTKNVSPNVIVGGVPAKKLKDI